MMLHEELKDEDIPHWTTVRNRILEIWDKHLDQLANEMQVCLHATLSFYYQIYIYHNSGVFGEGIVYDRHVVRSK